MSCAYSRGVREHLNFVLTFCPPPNRANDDKSKFPNWTADWAYEAVCFKLSNFNCDKKFNPVHVIKLAVFFPQEVCNHLIPILEGLRYSGALKPEVFFRKRLPRL